MKEKVIGVLGGMGPEATVLLFQRILENTQAARDQEHARILIDNNPKIPERLPAILGTGESPVPMMVESGRALERAGADFIVIPCVSAHYFLPDLRRQLKLPIVSMIEETAALAAHHRPKIAKTGLLAALGTIQSKLFHGVLRGRGIETFVPEEKDLQRVQEVIFRLKDTKGGHSRNILQDEVAHMGRGLVQKGAQAIIIGCTELSLISLPRDFPAPVFDAMTIVARAAVKKAGHQPSLNSGFANRT
jgi:aspartate racemase